MNYQVGDKVTMSYTNSHTARWSGKINKIINDTTLSVTQLSGHGVGVLVRLDDSGIRVRRYVNKGIS